MPSRTLDSRMQRAGAVLALLVLTGCAGGFVALDLAPPPRRVEVIGRAPAPGYVWVAGYWNWTSAEYVWVPGRWAVPPRGYHEWVADRWERHGDKWRRVRGHWKH